MLINFSFLHPLSLPFHFSIPPLVLSSPSLNIRALSPFPLPLIPLLSPLHNLPPSLLPSLPSSLPPPSLPPSLPPSPSLQQSQTLYHVYVVDTSLDKEWETWQPKSRNGKSTTDVDTVVSSLTLQTQAFPCTNGYCWVDMSALIQECYGLVSQGTCRVVCVLGVYVLSLRLSLLVFDVL